MLANTSSIISCKFLFLLLFVDLAFSYLISIRSFKCSDACRNTFQLTFQLIYTINFHYVIPSWPSPGACGAHTLLPSHYHMYTLFSTLTLHSRPGQIFFIFFASSRCQSVKPIQMFHQFSHQWDTVTLDQQLGCSELE